MPVDYARRQAPKRKRPSKGGQQRSGAGRRGQRPASRAKKPGVNPWRVLLVLAIVVAFVGFLWWLATGSGSQERSDDTAAPVPEVSEPTEASTDVTLPPRISEDELPEISDERWQYIQELESRQVQVEVPEPPASQPHLLQCGSFRAEADAESLRAQIAFQGQAAQVEAVDTASGVWHRVVLGPYPNRREAQRMNNQLQRGAIYGCQLRAAPAVDLPDSR